MGNEEVKPTQKSPAAGSPDSFKDKPELQKDSDRRNAEGKKRDEDETYKSREYLKGDKPSESPQDTKI